MLKRIEMKNPLMASSKTIAVSKDGFNRAKIFNNGICAMGTISSSVKRIELLSNRLTKAGVKNMVDCSGNSTYMSIYYHKS